MHPSKIARAVHFRIETPEGIQVISQLDEDLSSILAGLGLFSQDAGNLDVNARDAMPRDSMLILETANVVLGAAYANRHLEIEPGKYVMLAVSDTGVGVDEEVKAHLFEPFFTTKDWRKGTGLGLAPVFGIVKQNQGHITVNSKVAQDTTVKIYLKRTSEDGHTSPEQPTEGTTLSVRVPKP